MIKTIKKIIFTILLLIFVIGCIVLFISLIGSVISCSAPEIEVTRIYKVEGKLFYSNFLGYTTKVFLSDTESNKMLTVKDEEFYIRVEKNDILELDIIFSTEYYSGFKIKNWKFIEKNN